MANNKIQIKRSVANATVTGLSNGELAFTQASNTLHIGLPDGSGVLRIGGAQYPGVLTNSHALVANSTGGIDKAIVGNAVIGTLWANGAAGTNGQVLVTNGTAVYWGTGTSGSNTYVQFNDSGVANGVAGFTFDKVSNTLAVSNTVSTNNLTTNYVTANGGTGTAGYFLISGGASTNAYWASPTAAVNTNAVWNWNNNHTWFSNLQINSTSLAWIGNTSTSPTVTFANSGVVSIGNSSTTQTTSIITIANTTGNVQITPGTTSILATGVINAASFGTGAIGTGTGGVLSNTTTIVVGNNTINTVITSAGLVVNGTAIVANNSGVWTTGTVNGSTISVGTVVVANTTTLNANGLVVNSTGAYVTGLTNSTSFNSGAPGTGAGGSVTNATTVFVGNNTVNSVLTSAGLTVNGATTVNSTTVAISTNFIANSTKVTFTGANIDATSAFLKVADAVISGNLVVSGSVVSVNTATLQVNDNIIELADNNISTDVVDAGWYSPAGNGVSVWYSGLVRQAAKSTNNNPYFWLFGSNTNPNTATTVDTTSNSTTGTLQAYLVPYGTGGAFVANSSNVQITANSTLGVNIVANTLTLATALAGTSGGTGKATVANNSLLYGNSTNGYNELVFNTTGGYVLQSNGTAIVYDVLDGGSF